MRVRTGLEVLCEDQADKVRGAKIGLVCHPASVDADLVHAADRLQAVGAKIERLFAPEHGVGGGHQDMITIDETRDPLTGLPIVSLYGETEASLTPSPEQFEGLDLIVADLMDVGSRYYTFAATVIRVAGAALERGVRVLVADRPNPLNGEQIEGGLIDEGFFSFVGELSVANRHGMTVGELCRVAQAQRRWPEGLEIVRCEGWQRSMWWDETGLEWVLPSPNMPTLDTAIVYPGGCLIEGTNLSEARGTTRPFELIGAPWLDASRMADTLNQLELPGLRFRPAQFLPGFQKHAGRVCSGVQLHVTDRSALDALTAGLAVVIAARAQDPEAFAWRTECYEFVDDIPAFDLLAGNARWRSQIEQGASAVEVRATMSESKAEFEQFRKPFLLY